MREPCVSLTGAEELAPAAPRAFTTTSFEDLALSAALTGDPARVDMRITRPIFQVALSAGACRILKQAQRGGSWTAAYSEALSFEMLARHARARLVATELEIEYSRRDSKRTDYLCRLGDVVVAVSVTRVFSARRADVAALIHRKLAAARAADRNCANNAWSRHVLHVWCRTDAAVGVVEAVVSEIPEDESGATVLVSRFEEPGDGAATAYCPVFGKAFSL